MPTVAARREVFAPDRSNFMFCGVVAIMVNFVNPRFGNCVSGFVLRSHGLSLSDRPREAFGAEGVECYTADVLNSGLRNRSSDLPKSQIGFVARPHLSAYKITRLAALLQRFTRCTLRSKVRFDA
jgi:hypothetical protein